MAGIVSAGNVRIRGKRDNLIHFLQHELIPIFELKNKQVEERPFQIRIENQGWTVILHRNPETSQRIYLKGSDQYWFDMPKIDTEIELSNKTNTKDDQVICLTEYEGPWSPNYEFLQQKAVENKVDIRIFTWDKGVWSSVSTFYRNGDIEETTRKYEDFLWDCPVPECYDGYC